jgi:hypothetical protein
LLKDAKRSRPAPPASSRRAGGAAKGADRSLGRLYQLEKGVAMAPFLYDHFNLTEMTLRIDCPHSVRKCQLAGLQFMYRAGAKQ